VRHDLFLLHLAEERVDQRMYHAARDRRDRHELARVRQDLVARVQDADIHHRVVVDVIREGRAHAIPVGPPGAEVVLHQPLAEAFVLYGRAVVDAETLQQSEFPRTRGGHDAVRHRVREAARRRDPVGEVRVREAREANDRTAQDRTVAPQVVAALRGEGPRPTVAPKAQRRDDGAEGSPRRGSIPLRSR
jgi:hypothetical protein